MLDILKSVEAIIAIAAAIISAFLFLLYAIDKRQKRRVKEGVSDLVKGQETNSTKLEGVERRLDGLEGDVKSSLEGLGQRVTGLERSMETVARQGDIANLQHSLGSMEATVRASSTQTQMMFEAQLRREKGDH